MPTSSSTDANRAPRSNGPSSSFTPCVLAPTSEARTLGRGVILLVEDEPALRELLEDLLRDDGYTVLQAGDGRETIDLLEDHLVREEIRLVVLDMTLPQVDGVGVLRHIAQRSWVLPIVAISAVGMNLERARRHGAQQTVAKPFDLDRFLETVHRACGAAAQQGSRAADADGVAAVGQQRAGH